MSAMPSTDGSFYAIASFVIVLKFSTIGRRIGFEYAYHFVEYAYE
jgi:hypothetical protein